MKYAMMILAIGVSAALISCQRENMEGRLQVAMTDAPGDYQQVNVEVLGVEVHYATFANAAEGAWVSLDAEEGIYDLLTLQNGVTTTIAADQDIPAGKITQIRLLLGSQNSVMVDSLMFPMKVPSGAESGLKIQINETIDPDAPAFILLDFDAAESVHLEGTGLYSLRPVIKALK